MGEAVKHRFHNEEEDSDDELFESEAFSSDSENDDDDNSAGHASSSSSPPSDSSNGPLYNLSSLMQQLPVKKGLSKHYNGKSQSFTSLAEVQSLEDLPKKENPYMRRIKPCKSYATGLDGSQKPIHSQSMPDKPPRVSSYASFVSTRK